MLVDGGDTRCRIAVVTTLSNFIGGQWTELRSGAKRRRSFNPADRTEAVCESPDSSAADVESALAAAQGAFPGWSRTPMPQRAGLLELLIGQLKQREEPLVRAITRENGKTLREARLEFVAAIREADFQVGQGRRGSGRSRPCEGPGVQGELRREPLGVAALITPWNFPLNVACRKMIPALVAGNTCVLKPSELTPWAAALLFDAAAAAGLPAGVANLIFGSGAEIGDLLVSHPAVAAVSFTGSTAVGLGIARRLAGSPTKLQLELGGKNPLVVLADADLERAAEAALIGGFSCSGQWCTSTSRVIVADSIYRAFVERLGAGAKAIAVGAGLDEATRMGPVCGQRQHETILKYIATGKAEGARLVAGGEALQEGAYGRGWYVAPTVFADVTPTMTIAREEIFGPVLAVMKAQDLDQAIALANDTRYGLSASIYTRDLASAQRFIAESAVGLCHVNMHTAYKEPQLEFGGIKESGRGFPEAGDTGVEFFTRHKAVYLKALA